MGSQGTSGDLTPEQAVQLLEDRDYVLQPLPILERSLKLYNMKEWQCGIIQICDYKGEPIKAPLVYTLFFNNITIALDWMCTGETNKDGIFHTHVMLRTGVRSDSLRRSMHTVWNKLQGSANFRQLLGGHAGSMDCLKLQKCHRPESMMGYLMKQPTWVIACKDEYLEALFSIDGWNLNERFKPKDDEGPVITEAGEMNNMTKEIIDLITDFGCKTFEDCLRCGPLIMQKYLHRPGLQTIVQNCLQFVKSTGSAWSLAVYEKFRPSPEIVHRVLLFQGIPPTDFDQKFFAWITKLDSKKNTFCLQGPSNSGKSAFINGFKQCVNWGEVVNAPTFAFESLIDCTFGIWEEPLCGPELAEKAKQVMEGMVTSIPIKHRKPQMLPRTPLLITTNHDLWRFCTTEEDMFRNRMWIFHFLYCPKDTAYLPRTSEHRCKCCSCRASCGGADAHGQPSSVRMPREEQSLEQSSRSDPVTTLGTRPMLGAGEGPSGCQQGTSSSSSSSTNIECPGSTKSSSGTGSTAEQHMGTFRIIRGDNPKRRATTITEYVEPVKHRRNNGDDSTTTRSRPSGGGYVGRSSRGARSDKNQPSSTVHVESKLSHPQKKTEVSRYPKGPELDRYLAAQINPDLCLTQMFAPSREDWQQYLSYLQYRYG